MPQVKRLILDVLKPHHPNALEFAVSLANLSADYAINLRVEEMDDKTESVIVEISGENIDFEAVAESITQLGGSVHSIDEVEVVGKCPEQPTRA